jgi:hypothetical protein
MLEQDTHVGFALRAFSDAGSTPAASTNDLPSELPGGSLYMPRKLELDLSYARHMRYAKFFHGG